MLAAPTTGRFLVAAGNNLAMIEAQHGRHREALRLLDEAGRIAPGVGPAQVAMVLESRAWVTVHAGRLTDGLRLFDEAARAHEAAGLPLGEHVRGVRRRADGPAPAPGGRRGARSRPPTSSGSTACR